MAQDRETASYNITVTIEATGLNKYGDRINESTITFTKNSSERGLRGLSELLSRLDEAILQNN